MTTVRASTRIRFAGAAAMCLSSLGAVQPAHAEDFYKGKTITILLGFPPGGSYDGYSQLVALHFGKHIPGNPNIIVEHRPGGGGSKAGLYLFTKAPNDGTMITIPADSLAHIQMTDPKRGRWDMSKVKYIGRIAAANSTFGVRADTGVKTAKDLLKIPVKVGCTGKGAQGTVIPLLMKNLAGTKFTMVCGYRGSGPYMLAMERGETQALSVNWATWKSKIYDKYKSGEYIALVQAGNKRNSEIPNIPLIQEVFGDEKAKKVFAWAGAGADIGRAIAGAPGMPEERVKELRVAFGKLIKDEAFKKDVLKRGFLFDPAPGEELDETTKMILNAPKDVLALAKKAMAAGYTKGCVNCGKPKKN